MLKIQHDSLIEIATGRSRRETSWKNKELQWSALIDKLSVTHRTAETHAEYLGSKKTRQDEIKDIGGFVGGYLTGGRRKAGSVLHRQLITLDIDFAPAGIWDDFTLLYGNAAVLYSTHKHAPDSPRLRLIVPLDRQVMPDEYVAISRRVAGNLGIEYFDHTTFQPERLMYWPSTSKDGVYEFQYQDGPWLNADEVLKTYTDWRDSSEWPMSVKERDATHQLIKEQKDPLIKEGVVGVLCRAFTMEEAIERFLPDVYEPCEIPGRYTYKHGSTSAGLIIYDNKFAYSHHGTDPVSGSLCNVFDLIRLHKFGLQDKEIKTGTPPNKYPSYLAMEDWAKEITEVKEQRGIERIQNAKVDFADINTEEKKDDEQDLGWMTQLEMDRKGNYYNTINNIAIILENDPAFKNNIAFDELEQRAVAKRDLPWRKVTHKTRYLTDRDDDIIEHRLEAIYGLTTTKLKKAMSLIYEKTKFHPIRDYLKSLKWDRRKRVETLFVEYMGANDSDYVRAVSRKTLAAAVGRIFQPGIKFDYVLTLIGNQGENKSSLLQALGKDWFSDTFNLHMLQNKEGYEQLRGVWLIEIGEMAGMAKAEIEKIKSFISSREDRYRPAYGTRVETYLRQCILIGTTNKPDFLRDQTGNRRFWPIQVRSNQATKNVFKHLTPYEVDQVWAEAVAIYQQGEPLYLSGAIEEEAVLVQKAHTEEHPWHSIIETFLDTKVLENWNAMQRYERIAFLHDSDLQAAGTVIRDKICIQEIWVEALQRKDTIDEKNAALIRNIMRNMSGWCEEPNQLRFGIYGKIRKGFVRLNGVSVGVSKPALVSQN